MAPLVIKSTTPIRTSQRHKILSAIKRQPLQSLHIDGDFPGGNIVVESVNSHTVHLHQDLRDTAGYWFYWYFRVLGAAGRVLTFNFTRRKAIGERGPAVSLDNGQTWTWLGRKDIKDNSFEFLFPKDTNEARFCFGIPYLESNLVKFLRRYRSSRYLKTAKLCKTQEGRWVERLHLGCLRGNPGYRVLVTCRHHACEMVANYVLEGLMQAILSRTEEGLWIQNNVEFLVIPFVDKDGVENGDQGKNRRPHDHDRDYKGKSIYASVKTLREFVPGWSCGKLRVAFDLHCPWIYSEQGGIYLVGSNRASMWQEQNCFSGILEKVQSGPIVFCAKDNLPYG